VGIFLNFKNHKWLKLHFPVLKFGEHSILFLSAIAASNEWTDARSKDFLPALEPQTLFCNGRRLLLLEQSQGPPETVVEVMN
jgi:hypothetical protein